MWRAYTGVLHQIPNLQNCFTTPNKNLGGEGVPDRKTPTAKSLYRSIVKKSQRLGLESISYFFLGGGTQSTNGIERLVSCLFLHV